MCSVDEPASPVRPRNVFELAGSLPLCNLLQVPGNIINDVRRRTSRERDQHLQRSQQNNFKVLCTVQAKPLQALLKEQSEKHSLCLSQQSERQSLCLGQLQTAINPKVSKHQSRCLCLQRIH